MPLLAVAGSVRHRDPKNERTDTHTVPCERSRCAEDGGMDACGNPFRMGRSGGEERWREAVVDLHCRWMAAGDKRPEEMLMADGEAIRAELPA